MDTLRDLLPLIAVVRGSLAVILILALVSWLGQRRAAQPPRLGESADTCAPTRGSSREPLTKVLSYPVPPLLRNVLKDGSLVFLESSDLHDPQATECLMPGFFPFESVGNGDVIGLYWPLGSENPIILTSSHDAWAFIPEASSVDGYLRQEFCEYWDPETQGDDLDVQAMNADRKRLAALIGPFEHEVQRQKTDRMGTVERSIARDPASPLLNTILGAMATDDGRDPAWGGTNAAE